MKRRYILKTYDDEGIPLYVKDGYLEETKEGAKRYSLTQAKEKRKELMQKGWYPVRIINKCTGETVVF